MKAFEPHILVTDDDRAFRETLGGALFRRGFRTTLASDGEEAVSIVRQRDIHVVLMDLQMPRISGLDAIRQVQLHDNGLPCILISAALNDEILERAELLRLYSVLPKPISFSEVTQTIHRALRDAYGWAPQSESP